MNEPAKLTAIGRFRVGRFVRWFSELRREDTGVAGGKGANLGELRFAALPVPDGFVVVADAYLQALDEAGARELVHKKMDNIDPADTDALAALSKEMTALVRKESAPSEVKAQVLAAYEELGRGAVAVRSSATSEDTAGASFAGMNRTYTNVAGEAELMRAIVGCWASLFGPRALAYRATKGLTEEPAIAVVVQRMVDSDRSGVAFTVDPTTGDPSHIVIEAALGLGEVVVSGQVEPDTYVVAKSDLRVVEERVGVQSFQLLRSARGEERIVLGPRLLVSGLGASPGRVTGSVRVLRDPSEGAALRSGRYWSHP